MKVITFLNEKGGIGKTTMATHVAAGLALMGKRVILVDADAQAHATSSLNISPAPGLYDLLVRNQSWKDLIIRVSPEVFVPDGATKTGQLWLLPANAEVRLIPLAISDDYIFVKRSREIAQAFDYMVIDTSPTPFLLHPRLVASSHYILLPTQLEALSAIDSLDSTLQHINDVRNPALERGLDIARPLGIIPNLYREKTVAHTQTLEYLKQKHQGLVWEPVKLAIVFAEMSMMRKLLFALAPESAAAGQMMQIVGRILQLETEVAR